MKQFIYFDNAATTCIDSRVLETMMPYFTNVYGNASSMHTFGSQAKEILKRSRSIIAESIKAQEEEIIFTSGGTEANNFALKGVAFANRIKGNHIIVSSVEHDCILNTCKWLESQGFYVSYLPVDRSGLIDLDTLKGLINPKTILVSVMHANNEIGTIQPVEEIGAICRQRNVYFHSDACQSFGKVPIDVRKANIDMLTINSHKIYGPKGIGALFLRKGILITPLLHGGGQEYGYRSTTENIPGIVGFAKAVEICMSEIESESGRQILLRNKLLNFLFENFENVYINGHPDYCLPGLLNFSFHGFEGETIRLLFLLDENGIAVSAGSACSSNQGGGSSHVLESLGLNPFEARGAIRISFGRYNTFEELDLFKHTLKEVTGSLTSIFTRDSLSAHK